MPVSDYDPIYQAAAKEWNVDPVLLKAVSAQESGFDSSAVSKAGAQGLTGIMPATGKGLGVTDISDPTQQIYAGAKYLNEALSAEKTPEDALMYYHGGPDWRKSVGPESKGYVPAVAAHYQALAGTKAPPVPAPATSDPFTAAVEAAKAQATAPAVTAADPFTQAVAAAQKAIPGAAPPPAPDPMAGVSEYGYSDPAQSPAAPAVSPLVAPISRIGSAVAQGYENTPPILTPLAQNYVDQSGPIGRYVTNPLLHIAGAVPAAMNALGGGVAQAITEGAQAIGQPALGRDANMLAQVAPFARVGTGLPLASAPVTDAPEAALSPHAQVLASQAAEVAARRSTLPPANPLAAQVNAPAFVPPGSNIPIASRLTNLIQADDAVAAGRPSFVPPGGATDVQGVAHPIEQPPNPLTSPGTVPPALLAPTEAAPVAQSVGAAASRDMSPPAAIDMTPGQVQAYRSTAEGQKLLEPQQPGITDPNVYVPGVTPNAAEIEQTVNTARELKSLNMAAPEVSQEAKEVAAQNNDARSRFFSNIAGSDVDVQNAVAARSAQAEKDLATAFGAKKPTDAQPVADTIQGILNSPRDSENTAVQHYVRPLLDRLMNDDGTLKSDPEQLYGLREDIARMQSKAARAETPTLDHVNGQLQQIKGALDGVIEKGAPGYQQYLDNFSAASRPIDTMQALQGFENKLYDAGNRMGYNKVQTMMRQIVDSRQAPGLNPYKSIPDETMQRLWALRDDLRRSSSAQELAKAPGSDTAQNMMDVVKGVGKTGANLAVHGAILSHVGPVGNVVYQGVRNVLSAGAEQRAMARQTARGLQILHPDPSQLRNPLQSE